jgi:hypothetical protein
MRTAVFSSKPYDVTFLTAANQGLGHELHFLEAPQPESSVGGCADRSP